MRCKQTSSKTNTPIDAVLVSNSNFKALIAEWNSVKALRESVRASHAGLHLQHIAQLQQRSDVPDEALSTVIKAAARSCRYGGLDGAGRVLVF